MSEPKIKKTTYCGVRRKKVSNYWFVREATSRVSDPPSNIIVNCSKNTGNGSLTPTSAVGTHEMMERAKLSVMGGGDDNDNVNDNDDNTKPPVKSKVNGGDFNTNDDSNDADDDTTKPFANESKTNSYDLSEQAKASAEVVDIMVHACLATAGDNDDAVRN